MTELILSKKEFADRKGVTKGAVTRWGYKGLLALDENGRVRVEETEWLLSQTPTITTGAKTKRHQIAPATVRQRVQNLRGPQPASPAIPKAAIAWLDAQMRAEEKIRPGEPLAAAAERIVVVEGQAPYSHGEAVRVKENYLALLRQLEYETASGKLAAIEDVARAQRAQHARVRNKFLGLASRVAPRAAMLRSAEEVRALIDAEVVTICQELSVDGDADLQPDELRPAGPEAPGGAPAGPERDDPGDLRAAAEADAEPVG